MPSVLPKRFQRDIQDIGVEANRFFTARDVCAQEPCSPLGVVVPQARQRAQAVAGSPFFLIATFLQRRWQQVARPLSRMVGRTKPPGIRLTRGVFGSTPRRRIGVVP